EEGMVLHMHDDVQVARRTAIGADFTLPAHAQALAGGNTRRDPDGEFALSLNASATAARGARLGNRLAGAATVAARAGDGEEPLLVAHLAASVAVGALGCLRAGRRPAAEARFAVLLPGD